MRRITALIMFALLMAPVTGSLTLHADQDRSAWMAADSSGIVWRSIDSTTDVPADPPPDPPGWPVSNGCEDRVHTYSPVK